MMDDAELTPFFGDFVSGDFENCEAIADGIEIPLHRSDQMLAQQLSEIHKPNWIRSRVYRNSLAIAAFQTYCRYLSIPTERQGCDSDDLLIRELDDVADVDLPGLGRVECRPVPPGATSVNLPPEVFEDRQAYVLVELRDRPVASSCSEGTIVPPHLARILGFVLATDSSLERSYQIHLTALQPISELFVTLKARQDAIAQTPKPVSLWSWLEATVTEGWESLETLLIGDTSRMQWSFRMRVAQDAPPRTTGIHEIHPILGDHPPSSTQDLSDQDLMHDLEPAAPPSMLGNTVLKRGKTIHFAGYEPTLVLCLQLVKLSSCEVNIQLSIETMSVIDSLPSGLKMAIADHQDRAVMQSEVGDRQAILKFEFDAVFGEVFSAKIELLDQTWVEHFQV
jgi:hypothetical protein